MYPSAGINAAAVAAAAARHPLHLAPSLITGVTPDAARRYCSTWRDRQAQADEHEQAGARDIRTRRREGLRERVLVPSPVPSCPVP
uniref:Uncharacterized protein n=1 Tax=Vespula pensylvanica TaxID=30213 RepID=A0A834UI41_VESPE|nr:hypothetical protein H0235_002014 [Vespula pensylvanica]